MRLLVPDRLARAPRLAAGCRVLVGTVLALAALAGCGGDANDADAEPDASAAASFTGTPAEVTVTEMSSGPVGVAAVDGEPWVALPEDGAVRTANDTMVDVGGTPLRLLATGDGVWVTDIGRGRLVRIDAGTGRVTRRTTLAPAGSEPEGLASDGDAVWVVDQANNRVIPVDPRTGRQGEASAVGVGPRLTASGPGGVWVANFVGGSLSRVATDGEVTDQPLETCLSPQGVVEAAGVVWVTCTAEDRVLGLDADTLERVATFDGLDGADALAADGDRVYAVGQAGPTVWTIDAAKREVVGRLALDHAGPTTENVGAAVTEDGLAVTHPEVRRLYEVPQALLGE